MFPGNVFTLGCAHPPNINHGIIGPTFVLKIVEDASTMTMAIITANVVHTFLICLISLSDGFIIFLLGNTFKFKSNVLMGLTKSKIIN